jgi:NAD(P)-dependent dehydrogenase (short-subunit alcohol dehydrogenase family)
MAGMIKGKRVVVVGGSSGMGQAAAKELAERGAEVIIASRSKEKLERATEAIGRPVLARVLDMTSVPQIDSFFHETGFFDHLVISAADAVMGKFADVEIAEARRFFDSKFWGPYSVARAAWSKIRPGGSITFFAGAASRRGTPGLSCGSAINAAIEALSNTLAVELAPIRVNTISPGLIRTPVWDQIMDAETWQGVFDEAAKKLPARRIGTPEEIAHAVVFLIENSYMTGSVIFVDGGYLQS